LFPVILSKNIGTYTEKRKETDLLGTRIHCLQRYPNWEKRIERKREELPVSKRQRERKIIRSLKRRGGQEQ